MLFSVISFGLFVLTTSEASLNKTDVVAIKKIDKKYEVERIFKQKLFNSTVTEAQTDQNLKIEGNQMTLTDIKKSFLESVYTHSNYYFTNDKTQLYKVLRITKSVKSKKQESFSLTLISDVPYQVTPLAFEEINTKTLIKAASKMELYDQLEKFVDMALASGYSEIYEEPNKYYSDGDGGEFISDLVAGVPSRDYHPENAKAIYTVETKKNEFLTYLVFDTAIKVSKDKIKNQTYVMQGLYTLWYPNLEASEKAIQSLLNAKKYKAYTLETFVNELKKIEDYERIEPEEDEIIFEHLVNTEAYLSKDLSGLELPIPQSKFHSFDPANIEEGRVYFWIKKNKDSILKSKIYYFVLQDREEGGYIIGSSKLQGFNQSYRLEDYLSRYSMNDEIKHLKKRVAKGFVEISQEEIVETLTNKSVNDVLSQKSTKAIFIDNNVYDIYENIVQHWVSGDKKEDFTNHTLFFNSVEKRDDWIKQELAEQKSNGFEITNAETNSELLKHYASIQKFNKKYQEQVPIKEELLNRFPEIKTKLSDYNYKNFMTYSPLKIIEGNYEVEDSLLLNADATSLFITGDMIVNGTLMEDTNESLYSNNFLIVAGNVHADNYVNNRAFRFKLFAQELLIKNIAVFNSSEKLRSEILIHGFSENIKGTIENLSFNHEYSTTNKNIFVEGFFDKKGRTDENFIFNRLKEGKNLLLDNLNQDDLDDDLLLTSFKRNLRNWHDLYYEFAGFELQELEIGDHYGHYIESDQILEDKRHGTGMYLMSHDDYSLELVKAAKPLNESHVSSKALAYRFFWIMWTFSNWEHRDDGPMDYWKNIEAIDTRYSNGKAHFKEDPHLALYWVMHFGLLEDARFDEMKELMKDSDHPLIKGAFLFFTELKEKKIYTIEKDYKKNTTLFSNRITHHKEQIIKANISEDDMVAYTMSKFEKQPERTLEFISELFKGKEWDKILEYLENNPYQIGFSFLHILASKEKDKSKWHKLFIQEAGIHKNNWKQDHMLVEIFETFYKELDYEGLNAIMPIVMERANNSRRRKVYANMSEVFKKIAKPKNLSPMFESRLEGYTKANFDFQTFLNKSGDIEVEERMIFIRACIEKDLFNEEVSKTTISPYLLIWYLADKDFYPVEQAKKAQEIQEVIVHYKLNEVDFKERHRKRSKHEMSEFFSQIKKYF